MLGLDGMVFDDGVAMRLAEDRYLVTTTTGGAAAVLDRFEEWLQTEWPDLRVYCTSVTEQWAVVAVGGPKAREVLAAAGTDVDLSNEAFPFMTFRDGTVAGVAARVCRVSFTGELSYEVHVAAWHGPVVWEAVLAAGEPFGITPYGTEAMHVLRAEKGFVIVGQDTDGTATPDDLGMGWIVNPSKGDFVGKRSLVRPDIVRPGRKQLVGPAARGPDLLLPEGAQLVADRTIGTPPMPMLGHVTSSYRSAALGRTFALAMVEGGQRAARPDDPRAARRRHRAVDGHRPGVLRPRGGASRWLSATAGRSPLTGASRPGSRLHAARSRSCRRSTSGAARTRRPGSASPLEPNTVAGRHGARRAVARARRVARRRAAGHRTGRPRAAGGRAGREPSRASSTSRRTAPCIELTGSLRLDLLATGCPIDLDPRGGWGPGRCAQTLFGARAGPRCRSSRTRPASSCGRRSPSTSWIACWPRRR